MTFTQREKKDCRIMRNMARLSCVKHLKNMEIGAWVLEENPLEAAKISDACKVVREWLESSYCKSW